MNERRHAFIPSHAHLFFIGFYQPSLPSYVTGFPLPPKKMHELQTTKHEQAKSSKWKNVQ